MSPTCQGYHPQTCVVLTVHMHTAIDPLHAVGFVLIGIALVLLVLLARP